MSVNLRKLKMKLKQNKKYFEELVIYLNEQEENPTETDFNDRWCIKEQARHVMMSNDWLERRIRLIEEKRGKK